MAKTTRSKEELIKVLQAQVKKLQAQLKEVQTQGIDEYISIKVLKIQERFEKIKKSDGADQGIGKFFLSLDISAKKQDVYVPVSIASGKRATGFIYQIEGTAIGEISQADASARGEGTTQITLGTILYCKIPAGKKATFKLQVEIRGKMHKAYKIVINRINFKLNPADARYRRFDKEISTGLLRFH